MDGVTVDVDTDVFESLALRKWVPRIAFWNDDSASAQSILYGSRDSVDACQLCLLIRFSGTLHL